MVTVWGRGRRVCIFNSPEKDEGGESVRSLVRWRVHALMKLDLGVRWRVFWTSKGLVTVGCLSAYTSTKKHLACMAGYCLVWFTNPEQNGRRYV
jgi:hypothetical protein